MVASSRLDSSDRLRHDPWVPRRKCKYAHLGCALSTALPLLITLFLPSKYSPIRPNMRESVEHLILKLCIPYPYFFFAFKFRVSCQLFRV
ncbi:hypothetical protein F5146DRAFT_1012240 [Armillaria mellea]|nr:hypothetical protein F5146DRAFT_1012240 [Armillaria mellea]